MRWSLLLVAALLLSAGVSADAKKRKGKGKGKGKKAKKAPPPVADGGPPTKRKTSKDWNAMTDEDWEALERQWEEGDADEELRTEDQELYDEMERRKRNAPAFDPSKLNLNDIDPAKFAAEHNANAGPAMVFATLKGKPAKTKTATGRKGAQWRDLLKTGGIDVTVYDLSPGRILLTIQRGWFAKDVISFLQQQPELEVAEWNQIKYYPEREDEL